MNYLGHWLFSDPTPDALMGSLWPDFGKRPSPDEVSEEFLVHFDRHQWLDKETDRTPILEPLRQALRPMFRKTTPIVIDMLIDHHLALYWSNYSNESLSSFGQLRCDNALKIKDCTTPKPLINTIQWLKDENMLARYQYNSTMNKALRGIAARLRFNTPLAENATMAVHTIRSNHTDIKEFITHCWAEVFHEEIKKGA